MITIVHYGVGNISAFLNIFRELGIACKIAKTQQDLLNATKLILPGVGHFDFAMKKLQQSGMVATLNDLVLDKKTPVLGICVGMQMMANESEEGQEKGLGWINGKIKKIQTNKTNEKLIIPHMGWNTVDIVKKSPLFDNLELNNDFYFLHSYYMKCNNQDNVLATVKYGEEFTTIVQNENIYGIQCHPEKSHQIGAQLLENFAKI